MIEAEDSLYKYLHVRIELPMFECWPRTLQFLHLHTKFASPLLPLISFAS